MGGLAVPADRVVVALADRRDRSHGPGGGGLEDPVVVDGPVAEMHRRELDCVDDVANEAA